jgi:hypothetical protein
MLTLQIPMLLALLGTALMAVVIFAPSRVARPVTISFAPPPATIEPWEPQAAEPPATSTALWPTLVDRRACDCDAAARLAIVDALATVRSPWSETILRRALDEEPDARVHEAVVRALRA